MGCASSNEERFTRISPLPGKRSCPDPEDLEPKREASGTGRTLGAIAPNCDLLNLLSFSQGGGEPFSRSISSNLQHSGAVSAGGHLSKDFSNRLRASLSSTLSASTSMGLGGSRQCTVVRGQDGSIIRLKRLVGEGGYGQVYQGYFEGKEVAVKVLDADKGPALCNQKNAQVVKQRVHQMAELEAVVMSLVDDQHVVQTLKVVCGHQRHDRYERALGRSDTAIDEAMPESAGQDQGWTGTDAEAAPLSFYLIMEYATHGSLFDGLRYAQHFHADAPESMGPDSGLAQWDTWVALETLKEVASGLKYLHEQGIIHGDLKAANVLLFGSTKDRRGFVSKITDFGFCRIAPLKDDPLFEFTTGTSTYGTVTHMSPELIRKGLLSASADIYSFGITMWEVYTGMPVHRDLLDGELIPRVVGGLRPKFPADAPPRYVDLAQRCWMEDRLQRPSASQLLSELQATMVELCPLGPASPSMLISGSGAPRQRPSMCSSTYAAGPHWLRTQRSILSGQYGGPALQQYTQAGVHMQRPILRDLLDPMFLSSFSSDSGPLSHSPGAMPLVTECSCEEEEPWTTPLRRTGTVL